MGNLGTQRYWRLGSRVLLRRSAWKDAGLDQWLDLGLISSLTNQSTADKSTLEDPAGGILRQVDESLTKRGENYQITCKNMSPDNLALVFGSGNPQLWSQAATTPSAVVHKVTKPWPHHKVKDANGSPVYNVSQIVLTKPGFAITAVSAGGAGAGTITVAGDQSAAFTVGVKIFISGNSNEASNTTFTVASSAFGSGSTVITIQEATTGMGTSTKGRVGIKWVADTDYVVNDLRRATFSIPSGSAIADAALPEVAYTLAAVTEGKRLIYPQTELKTIRATAIIEFAASAWEDAIYRECEVSITPANVNTDIGDYAGFQLDVAVLADINNLVSPAGKLLQPIGTMPATA